MQEQNSLVQLYIQLPSPPRSTSCFQPEEGKGGLYRTGWSMNCNSLLQNISVLGHKQCASGTYGLQVYAGSGEAWVRVPGAHRMPRQLRVPQREMGLKEARWIFDAKRWLSIATSQTKYNQQHG